MKKILMRGGMTPLDNLSPETVIENNSIGANSGNLLYAYGVYRTLMSEDTIIDMDYYGVERNYTDKDIARINREYDAYVCPLADAFRDAFTNKLEKYTRFFNKLSIPCYIIGLGLRAPYEADLSQSRVFDDAAREFIKAALRKSSIVGLRGEITGEYLKRLGFREEIDFTPIGCPSMYSRGRFLSQKPLNLTTESAVAFNLSSITPENIMRFSFHEMRRYPNHQLIEQNQDELRLFYYGTTYKPNKDASVLLPRKISHPLMQENRYHIFINIPSWFQFLQQMDLSVGSKLHGNVAAVLSGIPALFMPLDSRMRELVDYHNFPSIPYTQIKDDDSLEELISKTDMTSHLRQHGRNFEHFIEFLNKNGLDHIYKNGDIEPGNAPLDLKMEKIDYYNAASILHCPNQEVLRRIHSLAEKQEATIKNLKKKNDSLNAALQNPSLQFLIDFMKNHPYVENWVEGKIAKQANKKAGENT